MATANPFETIRQQVGDKERSAQWYQTQVSKLGAINTNQLLRQGKLVNRIIPGFMYLFGYDPKLNETLPYYDSFPLVLPFRIIEGGFMGLNLHYMPYMLRMRMLQYMHQYASDPNMNEKTRLRFTWKIVEGSSRLKPLANCVKHYLTEQVRTRFLIIPYNDWIIASQLPIENFVGARKTEVWRQERRKYT
jgi:hypothetical protein